MHFHVTVRKAGTEGVLESKALDGCLAHVLVGRLLEESLEVALIRLV